MRGKVIIRRWAPSRKKDGTRGHWSHCKNGHPWAGAGPCARCRTARDAQRHAREDVKAAEAQRKQATRWKAANGLKREDLGEGAFVDFWRGRARIQTGMGTVILEPMAVMRLCLALCEFVELKPPSKLPKGLREHQEPQIGGGDDHIT